MSQEPIGQSDDSGTEQLARLGRAVLKHWRIVIAIATVVTVFTAFWVMGQTKFYRAELTMKIEPAAMRPLGRDVQTPGDSGDYYWTNREYYETQYKIIRSRRVAIEVVRVLGLHRDARFLRSLPGDATVAPLETSVEGAAGMVQSRLSVEPVKNSQLVSLAFEDADPARAQRILSTLADTYIQQNLDATVSNIGSAGDWLNTQQAKLKEELEASELKLHEYKKEKQLLSASLDDQSNMLRDEMQQLNSALTGARAKRVQLAARVAELAKVDAKDPSWLPAAELLDSDVLRELRSNYVAALTEWNSLKNAGRGDNHPEVLRIAGTMETTRKALLDEVKNVQEAYKRDLASSDREIGGLAALYESAKQRALDLNLLEIEYKRLARNKENTERLYSIVLERSKESELSGQMRFNNVSVVDRPLLPGGPIRPRVSLTVAAGMFAGLLLGLGFIFAREQLDTRIKAPTDIPHLLGLTCLGLLPQISEGGAVYGSYGNKSRRRAKADANSNPELWVHRHPTSNVAEAARAIRTNLVFMSPDQPFARMLVTSSEPADGKTTFACCLAITLAQSGKSVLLLDADLRRPRLHKVFGVPGARGGVTNALISPETLDELVLTTDVPNLSLLPTGPVAPNPAELLHSASFQRLLDGVSKRFDRIIIDSPPLVPVTDAAILSSLVDTTVLVVRGSKTRKDHAKQAVRALRDVNAKIAGVVLNDISASGGGYGYYEYSSYKSETTAEDAAVSAA